MNKNTTVLALALCNFSTTIRIRLTGQKRGNMQVPEHVAIILDGNGRWAKERMLPRTYGHMKGCTNLESICDDAKELGIRYLTVYAFSTENWKRSQEEVSGLMKIFRNYLKRCIKIAERNSMRMRIIGDASAFDQDIQNNIRELEEYSSRFDEFYFQIALNYGGRDEIVRAVRKIAENVREGNLSPEDITEDMLNGCLDTAGIPDPDLLIRTGGEQRISNFLLWQSAYTEFYYTDTYWPDFMKEDLIKAIEAYNNRARRFGG